jgi:hypothetical protein
MSIIVFAVIGILVYSYYNPSDFNIFPKCPVFVLTGLKCPGCGSQRAFYNLLHGNIADAFSYNQLMFILVPYLLLLVIMEVLVTGQSPFISKFRKILLSNWTIIVILLFIVVFTIVRNL